MLSIVQDWNKNKKIKQTIKVSYACVVKNTDIV